MGFKKLREKAVLKADASQNEETTAWCNRDLVPVSTFSMNHARKSLTSTSCHQAEEPGAGSTSLAPVVCKSNTSICLTRWCTDDFIKWRFKCRNMADTQHPPHPGYVRGPGHGHYNSFKSHRLLVLMHHSMVRSHMACWLHCPEPIYLGFARSLYPSHSALFIELHLVRHPVLEWWETRHVSFFSKLARSSE